VRECGRAMARRHGQYADLRYPVTPMLASMFSWADNGTDFGPSRNGDGAVPAGAPSVRESGRTMARRHRQLADLRYPATPTLAHMLMRAWDGTDFGPSRHGEGAAPAGAHSLRECVRAMARRRGQFAYDWLSVPPMFCTHVHGKFVEKRRWGLATLISNLPGILLKGPFRGLPVNVQLVPHHMHAHNPTVRVELEERTNLDLPRRTMTRPWGRCWQGGSARGTTDERKHLLAAIRYGG
jgi:hypothetical protein